MFFQYGYCPVGTSAILYRDPELLHYQSYNNVNWSGGIYSSQTLNGSRPGLMIAITWASLLYQGRLGFVERTQRILDTSRMLKRRIEDLPDLELLGEPLGPVMTIVSKNSKLHIHALGDEMNDLGWSFTYLQVWKYLTKYEWFKPFERVKILTKHEWFKPFEHVKIQFLLHNRKFNFHFQTRYKIKIC